MAFSYTLNSPHHQQLFLLTQCKFHFLSHSRKLRSNSSCNKLYPLCVVKFNSTHGNSSSSTNLEANDCDSQSSVETESGFSSLKSRNKRGAKNFAGEATVVSPVVERELNRNRRIGRNGNLEDNKRSSSRSLSTRSEERLAKKNENFVGKGRNEIVSKATAEGKNVQKSSKKVKSDPVESRLRGALDMCSKRGDLLSAIKFYDTAKSEGFNFTQYHYGVLLYLCSSAASGVLQPAKSGRSPTTALRVSDGNKLDESGVTGEGSASNVASPSSFLNNGKGISLNELLDQGKKLSSQSSAGLFYLKKDEQGTVTSKDGSGIQEQGDWLANVNLQNYALQKGFEIYQKMQMENISMNEAILTAMARMAMAIGDGDMAFDMVKQMTKLGINPRLRSYGPALSAFCSSGKLKEAFFVEEHMLEHGVHPEEHELHALLNVSVRANRSDKVYYLLHKLRTNVRKVSPSTADLIRQWFNSKAASGVGKSTWDERMIKEAIKNGGGGWHGQGWLGRGKWVVSNVTVDGDGFCKCCGVKLETIDLDPTETENFAKSVASIAMKREKHSSFQNFQKWLDYYGPFEAVIDAANVGLHSQCRFIPSKIRAVINGIRQMLPSKKYPLIILHQKRVSGEKMDVAINKAFIEKWKCADALYATPTGSNDDWYWLYAAIKSKCLLVTNDEMRDHIFQLLGNDFFPKWKERHQVRYSFDDVGPIFHMPPPCSVVIQESESGNWHIPVESEHEREGERTWLCITRANHLKGKQVSPATPDEDHIIHPKDSASGATKSRVASGRPSLNEKQPTPPLETYNGLRTIVSLSIFQQHNTVLSKIMAAEEQSGCTIDFQI